MGGLVAAMALLWLLTGFSWRHVRLKTTLVAFVLSEGLLVALRCRGGRGALVPGRSGGGGGGGLAAGAAAGMVFTCTRACAHARVWV